MNPAATSAGCRDQSRFQKAHPLVLPLLVWLGGLTLTLVLWRFTFNQGRTADEARFSELTNRIIRTIERRLKAHQEVLVGLEGLFRASKSVERGEFREYVKALRMADNPGAMGYGFVRYVRREKLDDFIRDARADEAPDFTCRTMGTEPDLMVVDYIEPFELNAATRGLDLGALPLQRQGAIAAVEQNRVILTPRIRAVGDGRARAGFLMFMPVFANGAPTGSREERFRALLGWVYTPLVMDDLVAEAVALSDQQIDLDIFDGDDAHPDAVLFDWDGHLRGGSSESVVDSGYGARRFKGSKNLEFAGRIWRVHTSSLPKFEIKSDVLFPWTVLGGGLLITALAANAVASAQRARRKAVEFAEEMTCELRQEIEEREQIDRALREVSGFQQALLESSGYAIISTTPEGVIRVFNPAAERLLGYRAEELVGLQSLAVFHEPAEVVARALQLSKELGCAVEPGFDVFVINACRGLPNEHEWTYIRKDGARVPVLLSVTAVRNDAGTFVGFLGVAVDISVRKQAAALLQQERNLLHTLIDNLPTAIFVKELDGRYLVSNRAHAEWVGAKSPLEVIGRTMNDFFPAADSADFRASDLAVIQTGLPSFNAEERDRRPGRYGYFSVTKVPLRGAEGEIIGLVDLRHDITEQKKHEATLREARETAESASKAKSEFLAVMSHEIRTPMNAIIGFAELLSSTSLQVEQRDFVEIIRTSGQSLLALINDILDYSKIEAGRLEVERHRLDGVQAITSVVRTLALQAKTKGLALAVQVAPGTLRVVVADSSRLRQVLINLVGNALKFTAKGGVTLTTAPAGPKALRISVTDTGPGIPPAQQAALFQKFAQADAAVSRKYGGTGLGLAICKRLVELMGGQIGLTSVAGEGSTFWLELPLDADQTPLEPAAERSGGTAPGLPGAVGPAPVAPAAASAAPLPAGALRVLVADDNRLNQRLVQTFLLNLGCVSVLANNGVEALNLVQTQTFDFVLMDHQMPVMDGCEASRAIRAWELAQGRAVRVPIIALTANAAEDGEAFYRAAGMDAYLTKPLLMPQLKQAMSAVLAGRTARAEPAVPPPAKPPATGETPPVMDHARALRQADDDPELLRNLGDAFARQSEELRADLARLPAPATVLAEASVG